MLKETEVQVFSSMLGLEPDPPYRQLPQPIDRHRFPTSPPYAYSLKLASFARSLHNTTYFDTRGRFAFKMRSQVFSKVHSVDSSGSPPLTPDAYFESFSSYFSVSFAFLSALLSASPTWSRPEQRQLQILLYRRVVKN